jgi:DDE superfamily endonuclease
VQAVLDGSGFPYRYLPSYSPDLSPIEPGWAKVKSYLRRVAARTVEALQQALAPALDSITAQDAAAFFRHCGLPVPTNLRFAVAKSAAFGPAAALSGFPIRRPPMSFRSHRPGHVPARQLGCALARSDRRRSQSPSPWPNTLTVPWKQATHALRLKIYCSSYRSKCRLTRRKSISDLAAWTAFSLLG